MFLRRIFWISLSAAIIGALYSEFQYQSPGAGALIGAANGSVLPLLEIFVLRGEATSFFRAAPFVAFLALRVAIYVAVIFATFKLAGMLFPDTVGHTALSASDAIFSLGVCFLFNLIVGIDDLLGNGVLLAFIAGRYHHPRREERALLFIDMRNSTAAAERLGEEKFLTLLNAFFADVTQAVNENGGAIHKYVGDETIASWAMPPAGRPPRCIEACLAASQRLKERAEHYTREFGAPVEFRAAMHSGTLVIGELGFVKREIAFIGDVMNTTARLADACRETGKPLLISDDLLSRLGPPPSGANVERLQPIALRGKAQPMLIHAVTAAL